MLKRILLAVSALVVGLAIVVAFSNYELNSISRAIAYVSEIVIPMAKNSATMGDATSEMILAVSEASQATETTQRDECKMRVQASGAKQLEVLDTLAGSNFTSFHSLKVALPVESDDPAAPTTTQEQAVGAIIADFKERSAKLTESAVATIVLAQKQSETVAELKTSQEELSKTFRASFALETLDAKAFNNLTRSVMIEMYCRSLGETTIARSKFADAVKVMKKASPSAEQETLLADLKTAFDKTDKLLSEAIASSDDFALFMKSANVFRVRAKLLEEFAEHLFQEKQNALRSKVGEIIVIGLLVSAATVLVGLFLTVLIARKITQPLIRATGMVTRVSENDLTEELVVTTHDEVGQIGLALNTMVTNLRATVSSLDQDSLSLTAASTELTRISSQVTANSAQTANQASIVSMAAEEVTGEIHSVSAAVEEMSASMSEISRNASLATRVANKAAGAAASTNATVAQLGESSTQISDVIKVITGIAAQTNLLALNATIEAARAGEAGRGFAVVAQEVKELAQQSAAAAEEISTRISAIQSDTGGAVSAIQEISEVISQIDNLQSIIAGAVQEQAAAINEISRSLGNATVASKQICSNIEQVAHAASDTTSGANEAAQTAESLARIASGLRRVVEQFKVA